MIPWGPVAAALGRVPLWAWALAAVLAWGGWQRWRAIDARQDFERATAAAAAENAETAAKVAEETSRRLMAVQGASDAAQLQAQRDRAAAGRALAAGQQLQQRIAALEAQLGAVDPAIAGECEAARKTAIVLADVLRRADARAGELAAYADSARTAGEACERAYVSLQPAR